MKKSIKNLDIRILQNPEFIGDYAKHLSWNRTCGKSSEIKCYGRYGVLFTFETADFYAIKRYGVPLFFNQKVAIYEESGIIDGVEKRARKIRFEKQEEDHLSTFTLEELGEYYLKASFREGENHSEIEIETLSLRQIHQMIVSTTTKDMTLFLESLDDHLTASYKQGRIPVYLKPAREEQTLEVKEMTDIPKEKYVEKLIQRAPKYLQSSKSLKTDAYRFVAGSNNHECTFSEDIGGLKFWFKTDNGWERRSYLRNGTFSYILNETYQDGKYFLRITSALPKNKNITFHATCEQLIEGRMDTELGVSIIGKDGNIDPNDGYYPFGEFYHPYEEKTPYLYAKMQTGRILEQLGELAPILLQEIDIVEKAYSAFLQEMGLVKSKCPSLEKTSD